MPRDFKPPYQLGELLEATTLVLIYFIVGPLIWWLVDVLGHREEQLRQRLQDLEQAKARLVEGEKLAAVGRLASAVAHEIRNPVAIISSAIEAAASDAFSAEDRLEMSRVAVAEARRLERLTTDFLTYAQPGLAAVDQIDAVALVGYIVSIARAQALNKKIRFDLVSQGECLLHGNEGQLQQALLNLLLNAVEASPECGQVSVEVKPCSTGVRIAIENRGPGDSSRRGSDDLRALLHRQTRRHRTGAGHRSQHRRKTWWGAEPRTQRRGAHPVCLDPSSRSRNQRPRGAAGKGDAAWYAFWSLKTSRTCASCC